MISVHREFIDCIDVDDFPLESSPLGASALFSPGATTKGTLHCTLFLFDDRLAVVKRQNPNGCGRKLTGLDDLNRLADQMKMYTERSGSATPSAHKKAEMSFRGMVDIMDISALDLGGPGMMLCIYLGTGPEVTR